MPADANTPLLGLLLQGTGNNNNTWGDLLNANVIQLIEDAVAGRQTIATTGGTTVLSAAQNRAAILDVTGSLSSNAVLQVSNLSHKWIIRNGCTLGAFTLTVKTTSGAAATVPAGTSVVWCDGANVLYVFGSSTDLSNLTAGTFSATLKAPDGTKTLPSHTFSSDLDTGFYRSGSGTTRYSANDTDILEVGPSGPKLLAGNYLNSAGDAVAVPVGSVLDFAGASPPSGWLLCFGQAISRTTFAALFAVLGTTYGAGDLSTTFNLPDLRGRGTAGKDDMGGVAASRLTSTYFGTSAAVLGAAGGAESHALIAAEGPTHAHGVTDPGHTHSYRRKLVALDGADGGTLTTGISTDGVASGSEGTVASDVGFEIQTATVGISIQNAGSGNAHKNVQPTIVMNKIIKY